MPWNAVERGGMRVIAPVVLLVFSPSLTFADGDLYAVKITRRVFTEVASKQPDHSGAGSETRFVNQLRVFGSRFHERVSIQRWRANRLESELRYVMTCDGARRASFPEAVDAQGQQRATIMPIRKRTLSGLLTDPIWLTVDSPLFSSGRDEETLLRRTTRDQKANPNKPDDSEAKFATVRTFHVVNGGVPNIIETWRGATLLERVHIIKWSASGPSSTPPMIEHVRREGLFKKDAERKIVETTVSRIEWDGQFKPDDFQLPKGAIVLDRISGKRAK